MSHYDIHVADVIKYPEMVMARTAHETPFISSTGFLSYMHLVTYLNIFPMCYSNTITVMLCDQFRENCFLFNYLKGPPRLIAHSVSKKRSISTHFRISDYPINLPHPSPLPPEKKKRNILKSLFRYRHTIPKFTFYNLTFTFCYCFVEK